MAKYAVLKSERDEAIARAVEAERLSNVAIVRDLEERLALVTAERDRLARSAETAHKITERLRSAERDEAARTIAARSKMARALDEIADALTVTQKCSEPESPDASEPDRCSRCGTVHPEAVFNSNYACWIGSR